MSQKFNSKQSARLWPRHLVWLFLAILLISCGEDPDEDDGILANEETTSIPGEVVRDPAIDYEARQMQLCEDFAIPMGSCFGFDFLIFEARQPEPRGVDVLWVVDSSGSMSEEQQYLGDNFGSFINELLRSNLDFQVAVTSTDVCQSSIPAALEERRCPIAAGGSAATRHEGSFVGTTGAKILKADNPNLLSTFQTYANVGINGSGFEHGLKAAQLAVEKVLSGANDSLLREDAFLSIIVVSDEEDDGIGLAMTDAYTGRNFWTENKTLFRFSDDDLITYLNANIGAGEYSVSSITATIDPATNAICTSPHSQPLELGSQYINVAEKTGGVVQSICEENWDTALGKIGEDLLGQISQTVLVRPVANNVMKVYVDDVLEEGWTYTAGQQTIKFDADRIPPAGSTIRIEYLSEF